MRLNSDFAASKRLLGLLFVTLTTAGCASQLPATERIGAPEPTESVSEETNPATANAPPEINALSGLDISERGIPVTGIGVENTIYDGSELLSTWVVTDIRVGIECRAEDRFVRPPENGLFVALTIDWETLPALGNIEEPEIRLRQNWRFIDSDGYTFGGYLDTSSSWDCLDQTEWLPESLGPTAKARGVLVLDIPTPSGTLIRDSIQAANSRELPLP